MAARVSATQRIQTWNVAEKEIMRYADDHALWHKQIHNVELDPIQVLKCIEMDEHKNTLDFASRRTGKTAIKELYDLKYLACYSDQELGIVAPREAQSQVNLGYHLDAIRRSDILSAFVDVKQGRQQLADTYYRFANQSKASAYGIMANVDGGDLTIASLEEVDDMPHDRLFSRFLLMLGSARRLGARKDSINDPQVRITGVYKGANTLVDLIDSGVYRVIGAFHDERAREEIEFFINEGWLDSSLVDLENYKYPVPIANAVNGMELKLLNKQFLLNMMDQLAPDEFARQLLCVNTASRNLIWSSWLQRAVQLGVKAKIDPVIPVPGEKYKKRGLVSFGYDASGHGEQPESSRHALVVLENISGYIVPIFAKTWMPGTDENTVKRDLFAFWQYFMPDRAAGDAYGVAMLTDLCDLLYKEGLTSIDRKTISDGESTASHWHKWPFAPIRFEGMAKHSMATSLASQFSSGRVALPYVNHIEEGDTDYEDVKDLQTLYRQLTNIEAVSTTKTYASYKMVKKKLGDDLFDAKMAGNWALMGGESVIQTQILLGNTTRDKLLE